MASISLTLACAPYDRTQALADGSVRPRDIDLAYLALPTPEIFRRQLDDKEFDVAEMSMSNLVTLVSRGQRDFVAIPVFPARVFRHSSIFVNAGAGIEQPRDLIGRRIGVPEYTMTAALFIRGLLQHDYGIHPTMVRWFWGGLNTPGTRARIAFQKAEGLDLTAIGSDQTLNDLLLAGELDALAVASPPRAWLEGSPKVRRLFRDYKEVERDYYRRTRIYPIMHTVVLRADVYDRYPWAARALYEAFYQAKERCVRLLDEFRGMLAWYQAEVEEERALFGRDYWPYGLAANRTTLEALLRFAYEQGLSQREVKPEELFAPETLDT